MMMMNVFIRKQIIDIILLQEVTHTDSGKIWDYTER
jgi:hypothetical protein